MGLRELKDGLRGKVALVTGASSGVGWATAVAFAAEGVAVVANARREERLEELALRIRDMGGQIAIIAGDASDLALARRAVELCYLRFGRLHFPHQQRRDR